MVTTMPGIINVQIRLLGEVAMDVQHVVRQTVALSAEVAVDVVRQTVARAVAEVVEGEAITYQGTLNVQIRRLGEVEVDVRHVVHQTVDLAVAEVVEGEETMTLSAAEFQIYILRAK